MSARKQKDVLEVAIMATLRMYPKLTAKQLATIIRQRPQCRGIGSASIASVTKLLTHRGLIVAERCSTHEVYTYHLREVEE